MSLPPDPSATPAPAPGGGWGEGSPGAPSGGSGDGGLWDWLRGLRVVRRADNRWFAGVAGGVADRLGVDPVLVRAGFVLFAIFGGLGLPFYLVAWALLPDDSSSIVAERAVRQRDTRSIVLLVVVGLVVLANLSDRNGGWWVWVGLPVAALVYWVHRSRRRSGVGGPVGPPDTSRMPGHVSGPAVPPWSPPTAPTAPGGAAVPGAPTGAVGTPYGASYGAASYGASYGAAYAAHASTPHGMGPGRTGSVATALPQWTPPRAQRPRAGLLGLLLTIGLGVAAGSVGSEVLQGLRGAGHVPQGLTEVPFVLGCALAGVGLSLVVIGLLGRRAGFTGLLSILLTAATVGASALPSFVFTTGTEDVTWKASEPAPAGGYRAGLGDGTLDLTGAAPGEVFDVQMGLGDLTVIVPAGIDATVEPTVDMGELALVDNQGSTKTLDPTPSIAVGDGPTSVTVRASLIAGDLVLKQVAAPAGGAG